MEGAGQRLAASSIAAAAIDAQRPQRAVLALLDPRSALRQQLARVLDRGFARDWAHHEARLAIGRYFAPIPLFHTAIGDDALLPLHRRRIGRQRPRL